VGVGIGGVRSILARASAVDGAGEILYDKYVRPIEKVTGTPLLLCCTPPNTPPSDSGCHRLSHACEWHYGQACELARCSVVQRGKRSRRCFGATALN
jgi:hypothetical protein